MVRRNLNNASGYTTTSRLQREIATRALEQVLRRTRASNNSNTNESTSNSSTRSNSSNDTVSISATSSENISIVSRTPTEINTSTASDPSSSGDSSSSDSSGSSDSSSKSSSSNKSKMTVTFAEAPSSGTDLLDYTDKAGIKEYRLATAALPDKFSGEKGGMITFREQMNDKVDDHGWGDKIESDVVNIPKDGNDRANGTINIITEYGQISNEKIIQWAQKDIVNKKTRCVQNNHNMVRCIKASLNTTFRSKIALKKSEYTVDKVEIAALLYKKIMTKAELDTKSTCAITRRDLQLLDVKMTEVEYDVEAFTEYVNTSIEILETRGESMNEQDLMFNILKGLKVVKDEQFRKHFTSLELQWLAGKEVVTADSLLIDAEQMYNIQKRVGNWEKLTEEQEQIVAMQATIDSLKDVNLKLTANKTRQRSRKGRSTDKNNSGTRERTGWKYQNPKGLKQMEKHGKTWNWCKHHNNGKGQWVNHHPDDCNLAPSDEENRDPNTGAGTDRSTRSSSKKKKKDDDTPAAQAMAAIEELDSDDDSSEDGSQG